MITKLIRAVGCAVLCAAPSAYAQVSPTRNCLDTLSASAFTRVPVFLVVDADSSQRSILASADLLLMLVNERVREALGGSEAHLPGPEIPSKAFDRWRGD